MRALSDHLARVGVVGCGRPLLEGSCFLALVSSLLSSTGILSRTWIVWTLMPMPRCSLRQGCPWVSQHEVGLWVRTGNPRPSAVSSQVSSGPTWSCPQMANPICPVAGRGQKHVHTGHMNKDGCCSWEACFLEEASFQWSLCHAYGFEGPFPVSPFPAEP